LLSLIFMANTSPSSYPGLSLSLTTRAFAPSRIG
jgi:hypothetical protein